MSNLLTSFELKVSEQVKVLGRELTEEELHGIWDKLTEQEVAEKDTNGFTGFTEEEFLVIVKAAQDRDRERKLKKENNENNE